MSENGVRQNVARYDFFVNLTPDDPGDLTKIQDEIMKLLEEELRKKISYEITTRFDNSVDIKITTSPGSIVGSVILILVVGMSVFEFTSKYKDFYESLILIGGQIRTTINRVLSINLMSNAKKYSYAVDTDSTIYPFPNKEPISIRDLGLARQTQSTGFFWYLLVMNIFLIIIIFLLVYSAVIRTYFGTL